MIHVRTVFGALIVVAAWLLAGCGSATPAVGDGASAPSGAMANAATATGTVEKRSLVPALAMSASLTGDYKTLLVAISSHPDACDDFALNQVHANQQELALALVHVDDAGHSIAPGLGSYAIATAAAGGASQTAFAAFAAVGSDCNTVLSAQRVPALSGTVTLTQVTPQGVAGSYNLMFTSGSLSGTFAAPICDALTTLFNTLAEQPMTSDASAITCVP